MLGADQEILIQAADWLDAGETVYLVTVIRTWGSSPRPPGSLLAVRERDGAFAGSVSGGCVEDDLCARLAAHGHGMSLPALDHYGITPEQTHRFGLPCGGRLDLVVERLGSSVPLRTILSKLDRRENTVRRLCLETGEVSLHPATGEPEFQFDGRDIKKLFGPRWRLLLIGAGQLSRFVAEIGIALDFDVVVCDPRDEYGRQWALPEIKLDSRMPDDVVREMAADRRTAVLALTHDPRIDDLALMAALESPAFYVGALGSRGNSQKRRARLSSLGTTQSQLARLHAPIGLPIGSRTPAEIAVAILAEITAVRRGVGMIAINPGPETEELFSGNRVSAV